MAETLRLELAPFHVKVLSVVTGALKTMGQTHFDDWKLPEGSLYSPIESTIKDRARGQEGAPRMDPTEYAKRVVYEIINGRTGTFWYGASTGAVKFGTSWLPTWVMVSSSWMAPTSRYITSAYALIAGQWGANKDWIGCVSPAAQIGGVLPHASYCMSGVGSEAYVVNVNVPSDCLP